MSGSQPIAQMETRWLSVEICPACGSSRRDYSAALKLAEYRHADEIIQLPQQGIRLVRCSDCALAFKDVLPAPHFLTEVFSRQTGKIWAGDYNFAEEARLVDTLAGGKPYDVLDIGASNGGLLKALHGTKGRRSALDIVMYPGLEHSLRGEFINSLVDSANLAWSEEPYDVVTLFDVAEHLYAPNRAFANLQHFVKPGGFLVIETGDADSTWPRKYGIDRWWYACRFEHHMVWSYLPFGHLATKHGFRIIDFQTKRHKERATMGLWRDLVDVLGIAVYSISPDSYSQITKSVGRYRPQPWSPFTLDHFRAVLKKVS